MLANAITWAPFAFASVVLWRDRKLANAEEFETSSLRRRQDTPTLQIRSRSCKHPEVFRFRLCPERSTRNA